VGATRTASIQVTLPDGEIVTTRVHVAVDVVADPDLGQRLLADDPDQGLNVVLDADDRALPLAVPVVYHDPAAELFVLVAAAGERHRELELRSKLYAELAADTSSPVPAYVREAGVVFGAEGLRAYLERAAERVVAAQRAADQGRDVERERVTGERRRHELAAREAELDRRSGAVSDRARELDRRAGELDGREATVAAREAEVESQEADLVRRQHEIEAAHADLGRRWQELEAARAELTVRSNALERALDHARTTPVRVVRADAPEPVRRPGDTPSVVVIPPRRATVPPLEPPAPPAPAAHSSAPVRAVEVQGEPTTVASPELGFDEVAAGGDEPGAAPAALAAPVGALDELAPVEPGPPAPPAPAAIAEAPPPDVETTNPFETLEEADAVAEPLPTSADPLTVATSELASDGGEPRLRSADGDARLGIDDGVARLWLRVPAERAAALARGPLDVRLQLHRHPEHAVITLSVGTPHALRGLGAPDRLLAIVDPTSELDRRWLDLLERDFVIDVELVSDDGVLRRARLAAPLADNVRFVVRAAADHQRGLPGGASALATAIAAITAPDHDLLGLGHPEHGELRIDKLEAVATANQVRRALAIARRFSRPAREDYLVTVRGFPLARWTAMRRAVLARAIACGLWMGPDLAQIAIAAGLARSPADLGMRLDQGFTALLADAAANDLDPDAIEDNRAALAQEASALGLTGGGGVVASDGDAFASGTIAPRPQKPTLERAAIAELIALLDDRARRLDAAIELCARRDPAAIRPVMAAVRRMSRAEAVRVLGSMVKFGPAAAPALTAGLASSKAFLRHGCALALALLRTDEGTEAVIDLLLSEPTEIWREIARAIGQVGPPALMPLAARLGLDARADGVGDRPRRGARRQGRGGDARPRREPGGAGGADGDGAAGGGGAGRCRAARGARPRRHRQPRLLPTLPGSGRHQRRRRRARGRRRLRPHRAARRQRSADRHRRGAGRRAGRRARRERSAARLTSRAELAPGYLWGEGRGGPGGASAGEGFAAQV
jgi:hypothetical protein